VFLGLDLALDVIPEASDEFERFRDRGVYICFVVYDILPLRRPDWWEKVVIDGFCRWVESVTTWSDKLICISRTTAEDFREWLEQNPMSCPVPPEVCYFRLGTGIGFAPTIGMPAGSADVLASLSLRTTFVTVGTIEPRKGHAQLLGAFDLLWHQGIDVNLVIVGKQGWMVDGIVASLRYHPQRGERLFWLEGISDQYLEKVYAASTALIAASEGEGFGLPLVEAAQARVPIIARDLPVFREIAGDHAYYFSGVEPQDLAEAVISWMDLHAEHRTPISSEIPRVTWRESAAELLRAVSQQEPQRIEVARRIWTAG
jgi:glycosyltransferase involved in cell wall biosynthesis